MQIIENTTEFYIDEKTAITIGKFDGVHLGHRALLDAVMEKKNEGLKAAVLTFEPSPAVFLGFSDGKQLTTKEEKRRILKEIGVDYLIEFPMNAVTACTKPECFIKEYMHEKMNAAYVVAGSDLSFGDKGAGNFMLLNDLAQEFCYEPVMIEKVCMDGEVISSTRIRTLVEAGKIKTANRYLGESYSLIGKVRQGRQLGRTLGMPTINLYPEADKILPPNGVYFSGVTTEKETFFGITNIGVKPTVQEKNEINVETFLYDFEGDLYGEWVRVTLEDFRRPEKKFDSLDALQDGIANDIAAGREYFGLGKRLP